MSMSPVRFAALAFAASALMACASSGGTTTASTPTPAAAADKAAPTTACTLCKVEVENRYDYQVLVYDRRETSRADVGNLTPLGKALPKGTVVVETKGRPNMGMTVHQDTGVPPTPKGLLNCRLEPTRPDTGVDYRYVCGN